MKFWFAFPLALLMLSPIWLDRMQDRMEGFGEGTTPIPPSYAEGTSPMPPS
jgi:hypothetical protein